MASGAVDGYCRGLFISEGCLWFEWGLGKSIGQGITVAGHKMFVPSRIQGTVGVLL